MAVLVCGPRAMVDQVASLCGGDRAYYSGGTRVHFELHYEEFEL